MKPSPILLLVLGIFLLWTGLNGTTGTALSSLFSPHNVKFVGEDD